MELTNTFQLIARSLRGGKKDGRQGRVGARPGREEAWQRAISRVAIHRLVNS